MSQRLVDTRTGIEVALRPLGDIVSSVDTVATGTRSVVDSIESSAQDAQRSVRDQIAVLNSGFRRLVPSTRPIHGPPVPTEPVTVEVATPRAPETQTVYGPPAPVDPTNLVPYFDRQLEALNALRATPPFQDIGTAVAEVLAPVAALGSQVENFVIATRAELQPLADVVQESLRRPQVQGVLLEPRRAADTAYALVPTEVSAAIDSLLDTREAVIKEYLRIAEALEKETHPEMIQSYADSLSELADMLAGLNKVIEAGPSAVGLFRMSLEALLGDMLYRGSRQFVPRKAVEAGVVLREPARQASFLADTVEIVSQIPKLREGVQSQVDALADGAAGALQLRDAYRDAVNQVAADIGARHQRTREKAERVGRSLAGARFAYREQ